MYQFPTPTTVTERHVTKPRPRPALDDFLARLDDEVQAR